MTVLVTGGTGYIGAHMTLALADPGERVGVLDNLVTGFDWAVDPRAGSVRGDEDDRDLAARVIDPFKAVSGVDFEVRETDRRPGAPTAIVAGADRLKSQLGWTPKHDNLEKIVASAWAWEQALPARNERQLPIDTPFNPN